MQCSGEEDIGLVTEGCNVVQHIGEQDVQHLNKGNCSINIQLDKQGTQHSNEKNCNTVSLTNGQEGVQCLDSIKSPNLSIQDVWDHHFSWPEEEINENKKQRPEIPYAITSKKWKDIQIDKDKKKLEQETLILERKNARLLKKK